MTAWLSLYQVVCRPVKLYKGERETHFLKRILSIQVQQHRKSQITKQIYGG